MTNTASLCQILGGLKGKLSFEVFVFIDSMGAKVGILSHLHPGLNRSEFFSFRDALFACRKFEFPGSRRCV